MNGVRRWIEKELNILACAKSSKEIDGMIKFGKQILEQINQQIEVDEHICPFCSCFIEDD